MIWPIGEKYKGWDIENIPSDYLKWAAGALDIDELATAADEEWTWREQYGEHFFED